MAAEARALQERADRPHLSSSDRIQEELAETYETSQSTVSRAITALTPLLATLLREHVPTADELDPTRQYLVDGTLLPCWSWASRPELYSGKHKTTGMNVQLVYSQEGRLQWVSDPIDGRRHDTYCLNEAGVLDGHDPANWIGDEGYIGNGMITPIRKPADRELSHSGSNPRDAGLVVTSKLIRRWPSHYHRKHPPPLIADSRSCK